MQGELYNCKIGIPKLAENFNNFFIYINDIKKEL